MAIQKKPTKTGVKKKKKAWYQIIASRPFNERVVGETTVLEPALMIGKPLKTNLMSLTNDIKKQNINIHFKITKIKGDQAVAEPVGFEVMPAAIKRLIRREKDRIDDSFICHTADGKWLRIKLMILTSHNTSRSVNKTLRKSAFGFLSSYIKKLTFEQFLSNLITYKAQLNLKDTLRKIYRVRTSDIRLMKIEPEKKIGAAAEEEARREEKKEKTAKPVESKKEEKSEDSQSQDEPAKKEEEEKQSTDSQSSDKPEKEAEEQAKQQQKTKTEVPEEEKADKEEKKSEESQ